MCVCNECRERAQCDGTFFREQMVFRGTQTPGHCCDVHECVGECVCSVHVRLCSVHVRSRG